MTQQWVSPARAGRLSRRAILIINSRSRGGEEACRAAMEGLVSHGIEPLCHECRGRDELRAFIAEHGQAADMIVVAGGDGTLNAAVAGVIEAKKPMGIIPAGTANDLARTLGIPMNVDEALRVVAEANTRAIDVGSVNGELFFNVASIGLAAEIAMEVTPEIKRRFGILGYAVTAARVLLRARPFRARIIGGGRSISSLTLQVAVGNGRFYGGGNIVTQGAEIDDGTLDLYSLEFVEAWRLVLMLRSFRRGEHTQRAEVRDISGREFEIRTRRPRAVNADGEIVTRTPAVFRVLPRAIEVIVPAARPTA
jgi:diacylglycerol kinase (ATP)